MSFSAANLPQEPYPTFDWTLPQTTFFLVWFVFFALVTLVSGIWYHLRRNNQPIKARLPILNSVANLVNLFMTAVVCFNRVLASTWPCALDQYQGYVYLFLGTIYAIRCWVLYFRFMWTQEVASCQDLMKMGSTLTGIGRRHQSTRNLGQGNTLMPSSTHGPGKHLWYSRHLYLISPWFLTLFYLCSVLILLMPPTVAVATGNVDDYGGQGVGRCVGISKGWETLIYMAYVCFYLYLAFRLATTFDYFHIKDELKIIALFVVPMFVLWIVSSFAFKDYTFPISTVCSLCILAFAQAMSTIYPLYLSYHQVPKLKAGSDTTTFEGLLRTEAGFNSFKTFLEGEFAIENLLFFQTAEDYKEVAILTINHHLKDDSSVSRKKDESSIKEGYLTKKGGAMNSMRRRYLVLKQGALLVYANKMDHDEELRLDLSVGIKIRDLKLKPGTRPFEFYIQLSGEKKKHVFGPSDAKQRDLWKSAFKQASKLDRDSDDEKEDSQEDHHAQHWGTDPDNPSSSSSSASASASASSASNEVAEQKNDYEEGPQKDTTPIPLPPRRAPRGYQTHHESKDASARDSVRGPSALKRSEGGPRPLIGNNWRTELVAYALEIFFVYIEQDGFAQVNLSQPVLSRIAQILMQSADEKSRLNSPSITSPSNPPGELSIGIGDEEQDLEHGHVVSMESSKTVPEEAQAIDMQSVVNLAARIERGVDVELLPNLFTDAQEEIFKLMQSDSFRRYIRSHLYRDFVEKDKKDRAAIAAMQATNLLPQDEMLN